jgi:signal transduction histidine kinase
LKPLNTITIQKFWDKISNIGIYPSTSPTEAKSITILNRLSFPVLILQLLVHIINIINQNMIQIIAGFIILSVTSCIFIFNYYKKHFYAKLCLTFFYPIVIFTLEICYGVAFRVQFAYMIIILSIVIFHKENSILVKNLLISWCVFFYFLGEYYTSNLSPVFNLVFSNFDMHVIFICSVIGIIVIISTYISENDRYEKSLESSMSLITLKNKELDLANKELERFAYIASHDLKTPLRTIVSYLDLIEKKIKQGNLEDIETYINFARGGGKKMNTLINEVLEYSRLNISQKIDIEQVDLNTIIDENITHLDFMLKEKNGVITSSALPTIKTNRLLVSLLFQNLLENGIKYNKQNEPKIEVSCVKNNENILLYFKDNGIGIEEEYKEKIFEMFTRLQSDREGSGMGLAICKKIMERLGGKIWFEANLDQGTSFIVQLPHLS